jgi:hypothetical protein
MLRVKIRKDDPSSMADTLSQGGKMTPPLKKDSSFLLSFSPKRISKMQEMYSEYGNVYGMSIMGKDKIVVCNPAAFNLSLRREGKYPIGTSEEISMFGEYYAEMNNTMGMRSLVHGPEWREWPKSMEADMYVELEGYLPAIADAASRM